MTSIGQSDLGRSSPCAVCAAADSGVRSPNATRRKWMREFWGRLFLTKMAEPRLKLLPSTFSPHLVPFIKTLNLIGVEPCVLKIYAGISFSGLRTLSLRDGRNFDRGAVDTIRTLLRSPALHSVGIYWSFPRRENFLRIWDGCSHTIKNLSFNPGRVFDLADSPEPGPGGSGRIKLESFGCTGSLNDIRYWLQDPSCPFDISGLKSFQSSDSIEGFFGKLVSLLQFPISNYYLSPIRSKPRTYPAVTASSRFYTILPENRHLLTALRLHVWQLELADAQALARQLLQLHSGSPNIKTVHSRKSGDLHWDLQYHRGNTVVYEDHLGFSMGAFRLTLYSPTPRVDSRALGATVAATWVSFVCTLIAKSFWSIE
ncbi:hypothetical protein FB45DRAFT_1018773 [Roridomyces roridus]|uniref:Uncharacterized protein n=1 Tax=Roridomyces roridus TaxID=1738132 RepID=A0AAD7CL09_9AGAR|nr:hypothetical protein FB45DRAFT_1018773 [Roridomyces roridus]